MKKPFLYTSQRKGKDFAWVKKRNPFSVTENTGLSLKIKLYWMTIFLSFVVMLYFLFFHTFFHIQKIDVTGLNRIDQLAFEDSVHTILHFKKFIFLPGESYILVNTQEIVDFLKEKYPIKRIKVEKSFPQTLSLEVEERISNVIYDDGLEYAYLDLYGNKVETLRKVTDDEWKKEYSITTSTLSTGEIQEHKTEVGKNHIVDYIGLSGSYGDYPIVYDIRGAKNHESESERTLLKEKTIQALIQWFEMLKTSQDLSPAYFLLEDEYRDLTIFTKKGPKLMVSLHDPIDRQIEDLNTVVEKKKLDLLHIQYIDLRFPPNIYWR
ncbi:MAG: hypothetical protein COV59_03000 [Candidatus Magasanikbacteria bacterium CG11_big_fil_rev_8_21_14_0_20_39_34]|uniref:POTRA domain-containing protein n=1 Tax=Candidatus Magasanikbacteria bacterium CG11_big_fil_rev_8_21_14_0_20_39_34 TaxID=1974653 RepID=A0A2H0N7N5_9BACT|nr:MAG: hypothetical protein COV59_03000 [Candidatus Magasanikbacteria bacterium CG11_big_fil_rev_8_21_14_0_20_39_34]